jgi:glycosyltransferase involved in cell wall biosynthesis
MRCKVAFLTNILAPYRVPIFDQVAAEFDVTVILSGEESNRGEWRGVPQSNHRFEVRRAAGFTFSWTKMDRSAPLDTRYLHVNPGLLVDLLRVRPDAIVTDEMGFRTLVALIYGSLFRRPIWGWWGGTPHTERGIGQVRRIVRRWLAPRVQRWFSYGQTSTEYLASLGVTPDRVVELQNCVPEQAYTVPRAPAFVVDPRPVLLCVARLVPGKGVDLLLHAAARLQAEGKVFSLVLVGDGPERGALEETARSLGVQHLRFEPSRSPAEVSAVYRSADVLVFPTLDDVWGLVVNEALWSGLPALVSVYAGCARELVPPGSTFDPLDAEDFRAKLRLAVDGRLPPPDLTRIRRLDEVGAILVRELRGACGENPAGP